MNILNLLTKSAQRPSTSLSLSAAASITNSFARRAAISAALLLSTGLVACGEDESMMASSPELSQAEALISASDVSVEELDLQTLALSATGENEISQVCSPRNLLNRGRSHHPQNQSREDHPDLDQMEFEDEGMTETEGRGRPEAQEERGDRPGRRGQRGRRQRPHPRRALILMAYDTDGDRQLSEEERAALTDDLVTGCEAQHARILEQFDSDGSGDLDEEELSLAREALSAHRQANRELRQERRETHRADVLEEFDTDGDGELNREERQAAHEAKRAQRQARLLEEFDADGDGELNEEERENLTQTIRERVQSGQRAQPESEEE